MKISIKARLLAAGIISILAILIPLELFLISQESSALKKALEKTTENISLRLAKNLANPLWDMDDNQVYEAINSEMMEERIFAVTISNAEAKKISHGMTRDDAWKSVKKLEKVNEENLIKYQAEITKEGTSLGFVNVFATKKFMKQKINSTITESAVTIIVLCLFLSIAIFFLSKFLIFSPLNYFQQRLIDIAKGEGDLTKRLPEKKDEIGELAYWINTFIESQQSLIKEIAANGEDVLQSARKLSGVSEKMNSGVKQIEDQSNSVASGAEEMNSNMNSVSASSEQANQNINMVATAAEELASTIKEISINSSKANEISEKAVSLSSSSSKKVEELGKEIENIGKVTDVITDISDQTNLLALNATIEAARAGEAGKGFAVVANEIKELAKQTADATKEIKHNIEMIQSRSNEATKGIEEVTKVINETNELVSGIAAAVEEQSATTDEIANNVNQASTGINEISHNIAEISNVTSEISKEIANTSLEITNLSQNSSEVNLHAESLTSLSDNLKKLISKFKV
ncbi:MAG: HAMP domain-containing methyl-accepting chemotaxis protein [Desulforegulaceae bacterium]|nr:HAMP domain-containing methyl-accepting chemotaxis protein [Desulforegulaceae bacterium]